MANETLEMMFEAARRARMTPEQKEEQRRSFAFGNTSIENGLITRETIDRAADAMKAQGHGSRR